jgi:hypothetical protein
MAGGDHDTGRSTWANVAIGLALFCGFFAGSWVMPLSEPDEGRYGEIGVQFARGSDWLTPRLDGFAYYEKPPLFFWAEALCVRALGATELAVRLPSVLCATLTALIVVQLGTRLFSRRAGLVAGGLLASTPLFQLLARFAMVDPLLTLLVTAALDAASRGLVEPESPRRSWIVAFWAFMGAACLTKGPVGVVLPLGAVMTWLALGRDVARARSLFAPAGPIAFLAVAAPWFVVMSARNPGFAREFFLSQNLARFATGGRFRRGQPFWFYAPVLAGTFLPWSLFAREAFRGLRAERSRLFLACAVVVPFLILSAATNKLVYYILPLAPPYALLVASALVEAWDRGERIGRRRFLGFGVGALAAAGAAIELQQITLVSVFERVRGAAEVSEAARAELACVEGLLPRVAVLLAALGVASFAAAWLAWRGRARDGTLALAGTLVAACVAAPFLALPAESLFSARSVARIVASLERPDEPVLSYREYLRGLPFYLGHPVDLGEARYQEFGHDFTAEDAGDRAIDLDQNTWQQNFERLRAYFARHPSVLVVGDRPTRAEEIANLTSATTEVLAREKLIVIFRARSAPRRP